MDLNQTCSLFNRCRFRFDLSDRTFMTFIRNRKLDSNDLARLNTISQRLLNIAGVFTKSGLRYEFVPQGRPCNVRAETTTFFNPDIEHALISVGNRYPIILCCMYLVTSPAFLRFLKRKECVVVIQNYDFVSHGPGHKSTIVDAYRQLKCTLPPAAFPNFNQSRTTSPIGVARVPAVSIHGPQIPLHGESPATPIMHSKFIVYGQIEDKVFSPRAVAFGSHNMTQNATKSVEHMTLIEIPEIADVYYQEFCTIFNQSSLWV